MLVGRVAADGGLVWVRWTVSSAQSCREMTDDLGAVAHRHLDDLGQRRVSGVVEHHHGAGVVAEAQGRCAPASVASALRAVELHHDRLGDLGLGRHVDEQGGRHLGQDPGAEQRCSAPGR